MSETHIWNSVPSVKVFPLPLLPRLLILSKMVHRMQRRGKKRERTECRSSLGLWVLPLLQKVSIPPLEGNLWWPPTFHCFFSPCLSFSRLGPWETLELFFFFCFLSFFPILWVLDFPQTDSPMKTITNTPSHFPALAPVDKAVAHTWTGLNGRVWILFHNLSFFFLLPVNARRPAFFYGKHSAS